MSNPQDFWTGAQDAELERLMREGKSYAGIAVDMGKTKNSVHGRANRLGITQQYAKARKANSITGRGLPSIGGQTSGGCRFIEITGPDYFRDGNPYCGAKVAAPGESWCAEHRARCFTGVSLRRLVAA